MILNVSGRTDVVAFYSKWFMNRWRAGFFDVRNPFNPKLVSRLRVEDVDLVMFCTKNPAPIIPFLKEINKPIIFHITLTPYKNDIEVNVKDKSLVIEDIRKLSEIIPKKNIVVRYDPIFINDKYTIDYHLKAFERVCYLLSGYVNKMLISFLDEYKNVKKNIEALKPKRLTEEDYAKIGLGFAKIARKYGMTVQTCYEERNLIEYGFVKADCLGQKQVFELTGKAFPIGHWRGGDLCKCVEMADVGAYNTCPHFCKYCYANYSEDDIKKNIKLHNPESSLLLGELNPDDEIKIRK